MSAADERFPNAATHFDKRRQKRRNSIAENWVAYPISMVESPALRSLSLSALRVMRRLEVEHMRHGGAENGRLIVTYDQFEEWGVHRMAIGPAIRELVALRFVEITAKGSGGTDKGRAATRYRLTYVNSKRREPPTNEWRKIETIEEAEALAASARIEKSDRARVLGQLGYRARLKKQSPVSEADTGASIGNRYGSQKSQYRKPIPLRPVSETDTTVYISGHCGSVEPHLPSAGPASPPQPTRELDPVTLAKEDGGEAALNEARSIHSRSDDQAPATTPTSCPDEPRRIADDGEAAPPDPRLAWSPPCLRELDLYSHELIEAWTVYGVEPEGPSWVTPMLPEVMLPLPANPLWLGGFVDHVYQIRRPRATVQTSPPDSSAPLIAAATPMDTGFKSANAQSGFLQ